MFEKLGLFKRKCNKEIEINHVEMRKKMKRSIVCSLLFSVLILTACSADSPKVPISTESLMNTTHMIIEQTNKFDLDNPDLDQLLENYHFPILDNADLHSETNRNDLPLELVDQFAQAVYTEHSDDFIKSQNQNELMITSQDFTVDLSISPDSDMDKTKTCDLWNSLQDKKASFYLYQCDLDKDGIDEIIAISNENYSWTNVVFLLKKKGDSYVIAGSDYLSYDRYFSIFSYEDAYYLAANYDDYKTNMTKAVGLFALTGDTIGSTWLENNPHIYLVQTYDSRYSQYHLLYENKTHSLTDKIQEYINEIDIDLIYTSMQEQIFYGDEQTEYKKLMAIYDAVRDVAKANEFVIQYRIAATDANNDGIIEYFDKNHFYPEQFPDISTIWYDSQTYIPCVAPYEEWKPYQYELSQVWSKQFDGKTVMFSLYHHQDQKLFLLDARICEDGVTTVLLNYVIEMEKHVELSSKSWDYHETNEIQIDYEDIAFSQAFPDSLQEDAQQFAKEVQEVFVPTNYQDAIIPEELIIAAQQALFDRTGHDIALQVSTPEIDPKSFESSFYRTEEELEQDNGSEHIYYYEIDATEYYLFVNDSGGTARFVDISIFENTEEGLIYVDSYVSLDLDAKVIEYNGAFYLLESSYNYNSKYTDTMIINQLTTSGFGHCLVIKLVPMSYQHKLIYDESEMYREPVIRYVEGILDNLIDASPMDDSIMIYTGSEKLISDNDYYSRLKSVDGNDEYYAIDFNNDNVTEYVSRYFWFPSNSLRLHLILSVHQITSERTIKINSDLERGYGELIQIWFQEIEGKTITFRLFAFQDKYILNASLIEGSQITQLQTWILVPQNSISITEYEGDANRIGG